MEMVQKTAGRYLCAILGLASVTAGCAGTDLARLAPPGIIRYERIADEKEPNPTILAKREERRENAQARFPKLGETAAGGAKMSPIPNDDVANAIEALEKERDNLEMAVTTDALETAAASEEATAITQAREELSAAIEDEKTAAARERRDIRQDSDVEEK